MPNYRGIDQADLLKSINDAVELLEKHSIGPECQKDIDKMRVADPATGVSPLGKIAAATDDVSLAEAIGSSGASSLFLYVGEVLRYHALNNTDGKGMDVYKRLGAWDAMGGARFAAYYPIDGECQSYMATEYAKKAADGGPSKIRRLFRCATSLGREGLQGSALFDDLIKLAKRGKSDDDIKKAFLDLDISDRHILVDAASVSLGMHWGQNQGKLPQPDVMARYCVVFPGGLKTWDWKAPEIEPVGKKVFEVLNPFYATDEVGMSGLGSASYDFKKNPPTGIIFESTKRAAQAVADAMPDREVVDGKGKRLMPAATTQPPAPQPPAA